MEDDDYRKHGNSRAAHFEIEDPHKCFCCSAFVPDDAIICPQCGFPQNGDEVSQRRFLGELRVEKTHRRFAAFRVGHAFHLLLIIPYRLGVEAFHYWNPQKQLISEVIGLFAVAFFLIWFFGRQNPFRALLTALLLWAVFSIPLIVYDPSIILKTGMRIMVPYFFLAIGLGSYNYWRDMDDDLKGKNTG